MVLGDIPKNSILTLSSFGHFNLKFPSISAASPFPVLVHMIVAPMHGAFSQTILPVISLFSILGVSAHHTDGSILNIAKKINSIFFIFFDLGL